MSQLWILFIVNQKGRCLFWQNPTTRVDPWTLSSPGLKTADLHPYHHFKREPVGGGGNMKKIPVLIARHLCWAQNNFNRLHVCRHLVRQTKLLPLHLHAAVREHKGDVCFLHELMPILIYCNCSLFQLLEKQQSFFFFFLPMPQSLCTDKIKIIILSSDFHAIWSLVMLPDAVVWKPRTWLYVGFTCVFFLIFQCRRNIDEKPVKETRFC